MWCQLSRYFLVGHGVFCLLYFLLLVVVVLSYVLSDVLDIVISWSWIVSLFLCLSPSFSILPTLKQRRQHSKIIMLYIIRHQLASIPTATYIIPSTRNTQHNILPYVRTLVFQTSFFPSTIKIWNNLQPVITNSTTIPRLRKALQSTPTSGRRGATLSA